MRSFFWAIIAAVYCTQFAWESFASEIVRDDFTGESLAKWISGGGTFGLSDGGDLRVVGPAGSLGVALIDQPAEGWSIRTQVRRESGGISGLAMLPESGGGGRWASLDRDGGLHVGSGGTTLRVTDIGLNPDFEDIVFQVDALDGELRAWAWTPGEPLDSEAPLVTAKATIPPDLRPGVWALDFGGADASSLFRWFEYSASHIPIVESHADTGGNPLFAGDADQDLDFDQLDLVQVQVAAKYLTEQSATWGEGDWNGAPGGSPGNPPEGDGLFNQFDIIAAQQAAAYLAGPYAAIQSNGTNGDGQTSVVYDAAKGAIAVDAPAGTELTSINIDSAAGIFIGIGAQNLGGSFDNDADDNIFKATFGGSFGSVSFGNVAQAGLSEQFVLGDLSVVGSLAGGGDLGNVDLIYVPEPASVVLLFVGLCSGSLHFRRVVH